MYVMDKVPSAASFAISVGKEGELGSGGSIYSYPEDKLIGKIAFERNDKRSGFNEQEKESPLVGRKKVVVYCNKCRQTQKLEQAIARRVLKELEGWLVTHEEVLSRWEEEHEGYTRTPLDNDILDHAGEHHFFGVVKAGHADVVYQRERHNFLYHSWKELESVEVNEFYEPGVAAYTPRYNGSMERFRESREARFEWIASCLGEAIEKAESQKMC
uniref:Cauli_VI domain-containing protein n=1 Tax=Rhabditophanes sp. KR3021 TaxID=114890 RepID=A0AC35U0P9_9BILA